MPHRMLMVSLSLVVAVVVACLIGLVLAVCQALQPAGSGPEPPSEGTPSPKMTGSTYIVIDGRRKDGVDSKAARRELVRIDAETRRIKERLTRLIESLQSSAGADGALIGIRDELGLIAERLSPPIRVQGRGLGKTEGVTLDGVLVRNRLESLSEDVVASLREALASVSVTVNVQDDGSGANACHLLQLAPVRGFPIEEHEPRAPGYEGIGLEHPAAVEAQDSQRICEYVATTFWEQLKGHPLSHLVLIGRADRMPFENARYGGNRGLAQARANWVHQCLRRELPKLTNDTATVGRIVDVLDNPTMLLSAGPLHVPACHSDENCDAKARSLDRGVDVFACLEGLPSRSGSGSTSIHAGTKLGCACDAAPTGEGSGSGQTAEAGARCDAEF